MRNSCISHPPRQIMAIVREDYYLLTGDCVAAAILGVFEYWANVAIACKPSETNPWLGTRTTKDFEQMLLGLATGRHINKRLRKLQELGFIETRQPVAHRKALEFRLMVTSVQQAINSLNQSESQLPNGSRVNFQTEAGSGESQLPNGIRVNFQTEVGSGESQLPNGSFTIYKNDLIKKEDHEEDPPIVPQQNFEPKGGEEIFNVEVEIVSKEPTQDFAPSGHSKTEFTQVEQKNYSLGSSVPAGENENNFQPLTGKNPKTGKDYFPWQGLIWEQGRCQGQQQSRTHHANDPEFLVFVAKSLSEKYSMYKKMSLPELHRESEKYINRAQYSSERLEEIESYWRDFEQPKLPDVTVAEIKQMSVKNRLMALLQEAERRKATGVAI